MGAGNGKGAFDLWIALSNAPQGTRYDSIPPASFKAGAAARKDCTEFIKPTSVDGKRTQHIG